MSEIDQRTPDWQGAKLTEDFVVLPAFGDEHLYFAVPRKALLGRKDDGLPWFFLEFFSDRNDATVKESLYAVIDLGLERDRHLSAVYDLISKNGASAALMPATFTTGTYCHLECDDTHVTAPFAWENAQRATLHSRISALSAQLIYGALEKGTVTVARAAVECGMSAFLPRIDTTVTFNAADLIARVAKLNPGGSGVPFRQMVRLFDDPPADALQFDGGDRGGTGRSLGLAVAGRLRHHFGQAAPCPQISDGPHVALKPPPDGASGATRWDLRTPLFTEVPVFLNFDPFTPIVNAGARQWVTQFTLVPTLPDEQKTRRVTVTSALPPGLRNCEAIQLTLQVDQAHSESGTTSATTTDLYPATDQTAVVDLKYKSIAGAKPFGAQVTVVSDGQVIEMPRFDCDSDFLFIDTSYLPKTWVTVRATQDLLSQAIVSFALEAASPAAGSLTASLTAEAPAVSYFLATLDEAARLTITARDPQQPNHALGLDLPCRSMTADLGAFRDYGPQTTSVTVRFGTTTQTFQLEILAEFAGAQPIVLQFSTARPSMRFSYFATDIFRNRYRYRRHSSTDDHQAPWSEFLPPRQDLVIDAARLDAGRH
ncbi:hypothetical protein ACVW1A_000037 [Bradyrhizobium sp. LB1.3]